MNWFKLNVESNYMYIYTCWGYIIFILQWMKMKWAKWVKWAGKWAKWAEKWVFIFVTREIPSLKKKSVCILSTKNISFSKLKMA